MSQRSHEADERCSARKRGNNRWTLKWYVNLDLVVTYNKTQQQQWQQRTKTKTQSVPQEEEKTFFLHGEHGHTSDYLIFFERARAHVVGIENSTNEAQIKASTNKIKNRRVEMLQECVTMMCHVWVWLVRRCVVVNGPFSIE